MEQIIFNGEFFSVKDTLECGQVFRFIPYGKGFLVFSLDKCAYCYQNGDFAVIECDGGDKDYFHNYFDLSRDYSKIVSSAQSEGVLILTNASRFGKGIRILNQNPIEALISFVISQNNNIPRIKGIIERLAQGLGEKKEFNGFSYYSFPTISALKNAPLEFYKSIGLGYRAQYVKGLAQELDGAFNQSELINLPTESLRKRLIQIRGIGEKVADCALLFGFHRSDVFPVDTWIEKVYREDFKGNIKDRKRQAEYFVSRFKENSGYYQQYLFHYKRIVEKNPEKAQKGDKI